ncbi:peroxisomal biogenesis factor 11 [Pluteus cervinus]|uniref:Peroxisomal biogenesis factor 11 n=1 Tax=Pluteus cervinus TaxID=181527 RepID=A0ACD3BH34_9AGAR|nr:peroxisomal biogenesis factor 11 [Pluteus cervinus]
MASAASQVILHPAVSQGLKFGGTTTGRDKAYRSIQYLARFLGWYYLSRGDKQDAARWNALKTHLGLARKLLRLGKPLEHLQAALRATLATGPADEQITTIGRQLCYFGFLTYDALIWANTIKLINLSADYSSKITKYSYRLWATGIGLSLLNSVLKLRRLSKEYRRLRISARGEKALGQEVEIQTKLGVNKAARKAVRTQFVVDVLDLSIPATALQLVQLNDGVVGILGLISSLIGGKTHWEAVNKK